MSSDILKVIQMSDAELGKLYECFSYSFKKGEDQCTGCLVRDRCINQIVKVRLPELRLTKNKGDISTADVALELDTSEETAAIYFSLEKGKPLAKLLPPQVTVPGAAIATETIAKIKPGSLLDDLVKGTLSTTALHDKLVKAAATPPSKKETKAKAAPKTKPAAAPKSAAPPPASAPVAVVAAPVVPAKPVKKKAAPVVSSGKTEQTVAPATNVEMFPEAPMPAPTKIPKAAKPKSPSKAPTHGVSADRAKRIAAKVAETEKRVAKAKPPDLNTEDRAAAWASERKRSETIAKIKPGTTLERNFRGVDVKVTYESSGVVWNGKKWPTLYSVVAAITGEHVYGKDKRALVAWSVPRFFHLGSADQKRSPRILALVNGKPVVAVAKKADGVKAPTKKKAKKVKKKAA